MAGMWSYNGIILPKLRYGNLGESLILCIDGEYYNYWADWMSNVWCVDKETGLIYCRAGSTSTRHHIYKLEGDQWVEQDSLPGLTLSTAYGEQIVYNSDKVQHNTFPSTSIFQGTYLEASPAPVVYNYTPEITAFGWRGDDGGWMAERDMTCREGFHIQFGAAIEVSNDNGLPMTVTWYEDGTAVQTATKSDTVVSDAYTPNSGSLPLGTHEYYCVVTDGTTELVSDTLTLTVMGDDAEQPGGDGGDDGGGDSGGDIPVENGITDISLTINPGTVYPGGVAFFEVTVNGVGDYNGEYTLELTENVSEYTEAVRINELMPTIDDNGMGGIIVSDDETADYVMLTATSVENPLISATEMLYIDQSVKEGEETEATQMKRAFLSGYSAMRALFGSDAERTANAFPEIPEVDGFLYWVLVSYAGTSLLLLSDNRLVSSGGYLEIPPGGIVLRVYTISTSSYAWEFVNKITATEDDAGEDFCEASWVVCANYSPAPVDVPDDVVYRRKLAFWKGLASGVPHQVLIEAKANGRQLAWIRSTGTQYIDTGYVPTERTMVECNVVVPNTSGTNWVFGARKSSTEGLFTFAFSASGCFIMARGTKSGKFDKAYNTEGKLFVRFGHDAYNDTGDYYTITSNAHGVSDIYLGDVGDFTSPCSLTLFAGNTNGTVAKGTVTIYDFKIYHGEGVCMNLIPWMTGTGEVGMMDTVSNIFYPNAGTGVFEYGEIQAGE